MQVIAAGLNDSLQIGAQPSNSAFSVMPVPIQLPPGRLVSAAAGRSHSAFVYADGSTFVLGDASHFYIPEGQATVCGSPTQVFVSDQKPPLAQVSCGVDFSVFLTRDGVMLYKRKSMDAPLLYQTSPRIAYVDAGVTAPCAIDAEGAIFIFKEDPEEKVDQRWFRHPVFDITRGREFILAIQTDGVAWGNGRLNEGKQQLDKVPSLKDVRCTRVFGSAEHAAVIAEDGSVWMWGSGRYGKLGFGNEEDVESFKRLDAFDGKRIVHIAMGKAFTLFLAVDGSVYGCGRNRYGQLFLGTNEEKVLEPRKSGLEKVTWLVCGAHHSIAFMGVKAPLHGGVKAMNVYVEEMEDETVKALKEENRQLLEEIEAGKEREKQLVDLLYKTRRERDEWKAKCKSLQKKMPK